MTTTARHRVRVVGSTDEVCRRCETPQLDLFGELCARCLEGEIREGLELIAAEIRDISRDADKGHTVLPDDVLAAVGALAQAVSDE